MSNVDKLKYNGVEYDLGKSIDASLTQSGQSADAKEVGDKLNLKVDKIDGKGLSSNDYTTDEKTKLAGIENGANKTLIDTTLVNTGQAADAKTVGDAIANEDKKALAAFATDIASGSIAHFTDGADGIPMKDVVVHIEPVQAGSGDPSPDNVRPITGWTGAKVTRTGKNLLPVTVDGIKAMNTNVTWNGNSCIYNGVTITIQTDNSNNVIGLNFNGTANPYFYFNVTPDFAIDGSFIISPLPQGASYNNAFYGRILYEDGTDTGFLSNERSFTKQNVNGRIQIVVATGSTVNFTYRPMLRFASDTDSSYEPYFVQTYDITFPSEADTVYGGTLDVTKGELVVDRAMVMFDGTENWRVSGNYCYIFGNPEAFENGGSTQVSSHYKTSYLYNEDMLFAQKNGAITKGARNDEVAWKAYLAEQYSNGTPVEICYKLATPITYTLTPQEITSLRGVNNLWADTGDSDVEYRADTKVYVDAKVAATESNITDIQNNKVDKTTPLLNFDDTATDPLTDDGALANALTALAILDDVIPTGGGALYLKKALTKVLNAQITEDFSDKVTHSENFNIKKFYRCGNVITFHIQGDTISRPESSVLFTLPDGYRPQTFLYFIGTVGTQGSPTIVQLRPDGRCLIYLAPSYQSGRLYVSGTFIL